MLNQTFRIECLFALGSLILLAGCENKKLTAPPPKAGVAAASPTVPKVVETSSQEQVVQDSTNPPKAAEPADSGSLADELAKKTYAANEDWPSFRGDGKSTGVARTQLGDELEVLWQFKVKNGAFEGTPAIVGGKQKTVYIGDLDGHLFALDLDSGEERWKTKIGDIGFVTGPSFKDGRIFIGDLNGMFYAFDDQGKELWKYETMAEINSSANFHGDNVIFGSQDTKLYAVDAESGKLAWEMETADQVRCSVTIVEDKAFVAGCDGGLHIVNLKTGKEESSVDIQSPTGVTPAVMGDTVFVGTEQAGFYAIDWKLSTLDWSFATDAGISMRSSPAVTKGHVVFGAQDRTVYSLDPETGNENWAESLMAKVDSSPVIVGDRVFVGSSDGRVYLLELETGEIVWEKQLNGGVLGSPGIAFGRVVVATDRGVVYCLGGKTESE